LYRKDVSRFREGGEGPSSHRLGHALDSASVGGGPNLSSFIDGKKRGGEGGGGRKISPVAFSPYLVTRVAILTAK